MKTTVELPDELVREVKVRAASQGRRMKDVLAEVIRRGLAEPPVREQVVPARVQLPLVQCMHSATPDQEMTPERTAEILAASEAGSVRSGNGSLR